MTPEQYVALVETSNDPKEDPNVRKAAKRTVDNHDKKRWMREHRLRKKEEARNSLDRLKKYTAEKVDGPSSQPSTSPTQPSTSPTRPSTSPTRPSTSPTRPSTSRTQPSGIGQTPSNPHAPPPSTGSDHPATHPYADIITEEQWHSALFDKPLT